MPPDEIPVPQSAPNPLYPDGGNNPGGHPEAIKNPTTGEPVYTAPAAPAPAAAAAPAAATVADPAKPAEVVEPAKPAEAPPDADLTVYKDLKLADGFILAPESMTAFQKLAAEAGVKPEAAQKFLDLYQGVVKSQIEGLQAQIVAANRDTRDAWINETKAMPEFQGEAGTRNLSALGTLMDEFGSPEVRSAFDVTGAGDNPHITRFLLKVGQALIEGEPTPQGSPGSLASPNGRPKPTSAGGILYPELHQAQSAR